MDIFCYSWLPDYRKQLAKYVKKHYNYEYEPHLITDTSGDATRLRGIREALLVVLEGKLSEELDHEIKNRVGKINIRVVMLSELSS